MQEISNAELDVLEVLWVESPLTANEVVEKLSSSKDWHEKTVKTLLNRLVKKKAIGYEAKGRRYLYHPLINRDEYTQVVSKNFVDKLFSGRLAPMVAGFAQQKSLNQEDIEQLKKLIDEWEKTND